MLKITKTDKPDFFNSWIKDNLRHNQELRRYILENEQQGVCCYCEQKLTAQNNDPHIEHIKPRSKFPHLKHEYQNLVVSCKTPGRCGNAKGSQFHEDFIIQTKEDPAEFLTYRTNGMIIPIESNPKGKKTIEILNLNSKKLIKARRKMYKELDKMSKNKDDFEIYRKFFNEFPTFLDYLRDNDFPEALNSQLF